MKNPAIRRFEMLGADDRAWILRHLSLNAKVRLAHALGAKQEDTLLYEKLHTTQVLRDLEKCDAADIARHLTGEPIWLVTAILSATSWGWRSKVMKLLAPNLRERVEALQKEGLSIPLPMLSRLLDVLKNKVEHEESITAYGPSDVNFDELVAAQKESLAC